MTNYEHPVYGPGTFGDNLEALKSRDHQDTLTLLRELTIDKANVLIILVAAQMQELHASTASPLLLLLAYTWNGTSVDEVAAQNRASDHERNPAGERWQIEGSHQPGFDGSQLSNVIQKLKTSEMQWREKEESGSGYPKNPVESL